MPRTRLYADKYAYDDFVKEVKAQRGRFDLNTNKALGLATGMKESTARVRMMNPEDLTVRELRSLIKALRLDIWTVLRFIGYETKEVNKAKKSEEETHNES